MDLPSYLASLPRLKLDALYESPWTCRAVLRSLPPLAKQYVLRMLLLDSALPEGAVLCCAVLCCAVLCCAVL